MRSSAFCRACAVTLSVVMIGCGSETSGTTTSGSAGEGGTGATGGGGSGGGTGGTGGTGGVATTGGSGGTGGVGGGGVCSPGEMQSCYTGAEGTENVGLCKAGTQTCKANGEGFGACQAEITPVSETCATLGDDDCDGKVNEDGEGCACVPGDVKSCYSGPMDTLGVGICQGGMQACKLDATGYGPCEGEVTPEEETCLTSDDDDCDGAINEEGAGCVCVPGAMKACYDGPVGSENVGICKGGMAFCNFAGTAFGACSGEITPQSETCLTTEDDDCDGVVNEEGAGCVCVPGAMVGCYSGPVGTAGVGLCKNGTAPCNAEGTGIGACSGEVTPEVESCATAGDDDCDGLVNEDGVGCACVPGATMACYSGPAGTAGVGVCKAGVQTCAANGSGFGACVGEVLPGVEICATAANEDCSAAADCGGQVWAKKLGATGDQQGNAVARDGQDNVLVTGRFAGTFSIGGTTLVSAGGYDVFLAKLDAAGNALWAQRFGDASIYQEGFDVAADASGNVFVTGYFEGSITFGGTVLTSGGATDVFVAKLDASGNVLWAKRFGGAQAQYGQSLGVDAQGNVVVLVDGFGTIDFGTGALVGAGNYDMFVAKLDGAAGGALWAKRFGSANADVGQGLAVDTAGNVIFTGKSDAAIDFGGGALGGNGGLDALVVKLDPAGGLVWNKRFGNGANQFGVDVATDGQNAVLVTGGFEGAIDLGGGSLGAVGAIDVFVGKLSAAGAHVWSKRFGAAGANVSALGIAAGAGGDGFLAGQMDGGVDFGGGTLTSAGATDAFVVHLDAGGAHAWSRRFGGAGNQYAASAAVDGAGQLLLTGYFEQTIDFGGGGLTSAGGLDVFVSKLAP